MAELETQADSASDSAADSASDPISRLHRMSTTAGVGTQEYVAINTLAVVAALLGLATALSFVGAPFMALGAAGLVMGIVALRQIRSSNGTQGGRGLALAGIILSILFVGGALANTAREIAAQRKQEQRINDLIAQLKAHVLAGEYEKAHSLFAPEFRQAWPLKDFREMWQLYEQHYGIEDIQPNRVYRFATSGEGQIAETLVLIKVKKYPEQDRRGMTLRRAGAQGWNILTFEIFEIRRQG